MKQTITTVFTYFSMLLMSSPLFAQNFVTDWNLSLATGSGANQIEFLKEVTVADANYTWQEISAPAIGMGSGTIPTGSGNFILTGLPAGATIRLSIEPTNLKRFATNNLSDAPRLTDVKAWGTAAWTSMSNAFRRATNMTMSAVDAPNLTNVTNMGSMFQNATSFNQNISSWNTGNVTNMSQVFADASNFNQPIGTWNTANVLNMGSMFFGATAFNQPIGTWSTANVGIMFSMFNGASAFNQNIGTWTLNSSVNLSSMLNGNGMDCDNYSNTLIGWAANNPSVTNRTLGATGRMYTNAGLTARNTLVSRGWTITGDAACSVLPIEWIDFKATKQQNGNLLTWNVVATNQDYFEVERSSDNLNFQNISTIKASDNEKYEYLDNTSNNNPITYYRLKAVEYDGTATYSKIVSVVNNDTKTVRIYPNPANNDLFLENVKDKTNYQISNSIGVVVSKGITNANNNINIQELKNGVYFLQIAEKTLRLVINKQ